MTLVDRETLDVLIAEYPGLDQARKEFLVDFLCDADTESVNATLEAAPAQDAAFINACLGFNPLKNALTPL